MSKSLVRSKHVPPKSPSEIVRAYIRFDYYQKHRHSWHDLQDCLEALRLWEADNTAKLADSSRLAEVEAERDRLRAALERIANCGAGEPLAVPDGFYLRLVARAALQGAKPSE